MYYMKLKTANLINENVDEILKVKMATPRGSFWSAGGTVKKERKSLKYIFINQSKTLLDYQVFISNFLFHQSLITDLTHRISKDFFWIKSLACNIWGQGRRKGGAFKVTYFCLVKKWTIEKSGSHCPSQIPWSLKTKAVLLEKPSE